MDRRLYLNLGHNLSTLEFQKDPSDHSVEHELEGLSVYGHHDLTGYTALTFRNHNVMVRPLFLVQNSVMLNNSSGEVVDTGSWDCGDLGLGSNLRVEEKQNEEFLREKSCKSQNGFLMKVKGDKLGRHPVFRLGLSEQIRQHRKRSTFTVYKGPFIVLPPFHKEIAHPL